MPAGSTPNVCCVRCRIIGTTNLSAAATHYRMMRMSGAASRYRYGLRKLSFTGEPIDSESLAFAEQAFGTRLCSMYGTTEVGVILANYPGAEDFAGRARRTRRAGARREGDGAAAGRQCMHRRRDWRDQGVAPRRMVSHQGPRPDRCGRLFYFHAGRADDVIISAGWTMSAAEIEDVLLRHPAVREAAVIGVADAAAWPGGQRPSL